MPTIKELLRAGRKEEVWQMCCGFLDLNIEQFMSIQKRLLLEQIELLNKSCHRQENIRRNNATRCGGVQKTERR